MRNKTVPNSKGLASWLDDFIIGLAGKSSKEVVASQEPTEDNLSSDVTEDEMETTATININDLDKVVWNDETFRVYFDENGANVINEFGNGVTFLKGLKTIEEVDHALNDKQVVISAENEDEEIVTADENDNEFEDALVAAVSDIPTEDDVQDEVIASTEENRSECDESSNNETKEEIKKESNEDPVLDAIIAGFDEFEKRISAIEQYYARNPQFEQDEMASQVQEEEQKHFTETSDETQKQIEEEQKHDLTTPSGRIDIANESEQPSEIEEIVTDSLENEQVQDQNQEQEKVEDDTQVEKLTGKDEKIFQNGICPETGEELVKSRTAGNFLGVYSPKGKTEYAVDLTTGDIFKYKG